MPFGEGTENILLDDVQCKGSENNLLDCRSQRFDNNNCDHSEDVGVQCLINTGTYSACTTTNTCTIS